MSIKHLSQKAQKTLTKHQRSQLTNLTPKKRKYKERNFGYSLDKPKYWCSYMNEWYVATPKHIHCKLCYKHTTGEDRHEIIKYEGQDK